jgi:hypothetical protein
MLALMLLAPVSALAQGTSAASGQNGIGHEGSLTADAGHHASTVKGAAAASRIPISPKPTTTPSNNPHLENDPTQGGGQQR